NRPLTDFGGKTSIFSHPVYLFLREFSLQDFRGGSDSADVHLKDAAGEHQINGRKDGRMLYGVGLNARFGDNTRLGLEVERSAFGKYNTDDAINANIRYSF
ncbi:autotransporter outer membrane beta-barrel domain-containing protein, partial [Escherichia coli]|nr:autotransporter outer membrane beta-barrel domain-containing protein [Escherichia coli]